jgi:branched-chain amino acid transport system permease protein
MTRLWLMCLFVLLIGCIGSAAGFVPTYYIGLMTEILIQALFVMSLDLLVGYTGLDSLGHAAFFGLSAYVGALLSLAGFENILLLLGAAVLGAALLGALFGVIALRATGPYFLIITLALGYLPAALAMRWRGLTGGDDGLSILSRPSLFGMSLDDPNRYLWFVATIVVLCAMLMVAIGRSSFGYGLRGIKESPSRMEALGYRVWIYQYICFVIAAAFAGVAGTLYAFYDNFVSPDDFGLVRSAEGLIAVIFGGPGTLVGPAIGALIIVLLRYLVGAVTQHWDLVLGLIYIAVVLLIPNGLAFVLDNLIARRRPK